MLMLAHGLRQVPNGWWFGRYMEENGKVHGRKRKKGLRFRQQNVDSDIGIDCMVEGAYDQKRKRKSPVKDIDWEDFIMETPLLHQVEEEET
ncbi:unnamed protein product [Dovyalis caffra]|uniref:Uncharacterized protein n=1 Tax=Dovyalis caffra TaxID=77055 RepID=A0AAV1RF27_9ROSI|nr:unnamed protein product [Dovyalis caffra]